MSTHTEATTGRRAIREWPMAPERLRSARLHRLAGPRPAPGALRSRSRGSGAVRHSLGVGAALEHGPAPSTVAGDCLSGTGPRPSTTAQVDRPSGSLQARMESSRLGRAAITVLISAVLGSFVASSLPASELEGRVARLVAPVGSGVGLNQSWAMFSVSYWVSADVEARLEYPDGSTATWTRPQGGRLLASYRDYRWQKWTSYLHAGSRSELWRPAAEWLARTQLRDGQESRPGDAGSAPAKTQSPRIGRCRAPTLGGRGLLPL